MGLSDSQAGRRLLDWPPDVVELADLLGIERFAIVGWSGGGPYALACGYALGDRVKSVALVSAPAPLAGAARHGYLRRFDRNAVRAAHAPWVIRIALWHWGRPQRRDAESFFEKSVGEMCAADQEVLAEPELRGRMIANSAELYRQGGRGMYDEALVLSPPVGLRAGRRSRAGRCLAWRPRRDGPGGDGRSPGQRHPGAACACYPDEGHHLLYRHWSDILASLAD